MGRTSLLALFAALSLAASAPQPPSLDEIRADVAAGDYRGAVQKIDKQLFPSSQDQVSPERYQLLMLKGECRLQLKDRIGASSAFKSAGKAAPNAGELAAAQANALIIDRSFSGRYTPRAGAGKEPIDILPTESRKRAMIALRDELWTQYKSQVDAALRAETLPPIEKVFTHVADMFFLESFATGEAAEAGQILRDLSLHAYRLVETEVSRCAGRVDQLGQLANSSSDGALGWNSGRLGLTSQQRDELKSMIPHLNQIRDRASAYRRIAAKLGGDEAKWDALVANATDTIFEAETLFKDR